MKKIEYSSRGKKKMVMYFDKLIALDVDRSPISKDHPMEEFVVHINMLNNFTFQFDAKTKTFYLDEEDIDKNIEQLDELAKLVEHLDEKNPEEKKEMTEIMKENYIEYVVRKKVNIVFKDGTDLGEMVLGFIKEYKV